MIGAAIGILTTAISNISNGIPFWHGMGKAAVIGAVSGAISFGIGNAATSSFTSAWSQAAFQAGMHGMKSGIMSAIEGGDFGSGFLAGAVSSLVSSGVDALGTNYSGSGAYRGVNGEFSKNAFGNSSAFKAVMIASGGLSGGLSSAIAGGSFWKGVREGLITSGLNHAMHSIMNGISDGTPLKDFENEIKNRINDRISQIDNEIIKTEAEIQDRTARGKNTDKLNDKIIDYNYMKANLSKAAATLDFLIKTQHGYDIKLKYGTTKVKEMTLRGRVEWGSNSKSLVIYHNNDTDVIIHEMIHVYDVISKPDRFEPFIANTIIGARGYWTEANAWKTTYSLKGFLSGISKFSEIDDKYIKSLGY